MAERVPLDFEPVTPAESAARADAFYHEMARRRSVRDFSDRPVPRALVERAIQTAATAPSGAHQQPWTFVAVQDPDTKRQIREAAEAEERAFYADRAPDDWLDALAPLGTDWQKPFLETAPWLVVLFAQRWSPAGRGGEGGAGGRRKHYYVQESCGIAAGLFVAALHHMGLATLTHTPAPMRFLGELLDRPAHEAPFVLFPVGYPAPGATVPDLERKGLDEVAVWR
ncbi:nitroreductase family protein [Rubrivirga litoralis]|uniref:Nitroreductase family protein n=1 Tax=Rubrivirga litoralis TaxID=3075598 RepID=A0ABU3BVH8_9BACT|nr:nitroreductase family protein [Rubrivirga sp. F394]MDT0633303.1 nitroreductase family protein [Rubrivirga sp. F394]